ncbi:MAG: transcriptional regulator, partial [Pirellulaceae bacterium]|nr:transcriptional regulator [Pirellulaceae bacterium]
VVECSTRRRRILNLVQEALSQLRLDMKYLVFDLEATRRERDQYRQMLEKEGLL